MEQGWRVSLPHQGTPIIRRSRLACLDYDLSTAGSNSIHAFVSTWQTASKNKIKALLTVTHK